MAVEDRQAYFYALASLLARPFPQPPSQKLRMYWDQPGILPFPSPPTPRTGAVSIPMTGAACRRNS